MTKSKEKVQVEYIHMEQTKYDQIYYIEVWSKVLNKYTVESPIYDLGDISRQQYVDYFVRSFLKSRTTADNIKIVDFGAGNWLYLGTILQAINDYNDITEEPKKFEIIGVDYSKQALEFGKLKFQNLIPNNVKILTHVGDINHIAQMMEKSSFDLIIAMETMEHLYRDWEFIEIASKLLKNDGRIVISVPNNSPFFLSKNWFIYTFCRKKFSQKDENVGHLRRYSIKMIGEMAHKFGMQLSETKCYGFFLSDYLKSMLRMKEKCFKKIFPTSFRLCKRIVQLENKFYNKISVKHSEGFFCVLTKRG